MRNGKARLHINHRTIYHQLYLGILFLLLLFDSWWLLCHMSGSHMAKTNFYLALYIHLRATYTHIVHMLQPYVVSFETRNKKKKCSQMSMQRIPLLLKMIWLYDLCAWMCAVQFSRPSIREYWYRLTITGILRYFTLVLHRGLHETPYLARLAFRGSQRYFAEFLEFSKVPSSWVWGSLRRIDSTKRRWKHDITVFLYQNRIP